MKLKMIYEAESRQASRRNTPLPSTPTPNYHYQYSYDYSNNTSPHPDDSNDVSASHLETHSQSENSAELSTDLSNKPKAADEGREWLSNDSRILDLFGHDKKGSAKGSVDR
jgi:hypothetical protein